MSVVFIHIVLCVRNISTSNVKSFLAVCLHGGASTVACYYRVEDELLNAVSLFDRQRSAVSCGCIQSGTADTLEGCFRAIKAVIIFYCSWLQQKLFVNDT